MKDTEKKKILIIDANSLVHRGFHALPPLSTQSGRQTNAVFGFLMVLFSAIKDLRPDYMVAAFDLPSPTFRHEQFKDYKAHRPKTPPELIEQFPLVKEVLEVLHIPVIEKEGFEADDILGTVKEHLKDNADVESIIVSGDLDTLQLVDAKTKVYTLRKGVKDTTVYTEHAVHDRYGLTPQQLIDYKALRGDPSDNIPGVPGIGEKTATQLIQTFHDLDNLYAELEKDSGKAGELKKGVRQKLDDNKDQAFFSRELVKIRLDAPIDFKLETAKWQEYDVMEATHKLQDLEMASLIPRLPQLGEDAPSPDDTQDDPPAGEPLKLW